MSDHYCVIILGLCVVFSVFLNFFFQYYSFSTNILNFSCIPVLRSSVTSWQGLARVPCMDRWIHVIMFIIIFFFCMFVTMRSRFLVTVFDNG